MKKRISGKATMHSCATLDGILLEYSLIRSDKRIGGSFSYSLILEETADGQKEVVSAYDISRSKRRACKVFRLICDGKVTACTFFEILEEIL